MANYGITIGDYVVNPKNGVRSVLRNTMVYCKGFRSLESLEQYVLDWGPYKNWGFDIMPGARTEKEHSISYTSWMTVRKNGLGCDNRAELDYIFKMEIYEDGHLDDAWMMAKQGKSGTPLNTVVLENPRPSEY